MSERSSAWERRVERAHDVYVGFVAWAAAAVAVAIAVGSLVLTATNRDWRFVLVAVTAASVAAMILVSHRSIK